MTTTTLEHVVEIDATPAAVYDLWTTVDGLCAWWGADATVDARPGGTIRVDIDGEHVMVGEFVAVDPPTRLTFTFGWEDGHPEPGSTRVDVRIEATESGSRLTLRHHGLPIDLITVHAEGWNHFLGDRITTIEETA